MKKLNLFCIIGFALLIMCKSSPRVSSSEPLLCYVGGTMRPAVEKLAEAYQSKYNKKIDIDYSSSGEALIKVKQTGKGDIIVVHDPYAGALKKENLSVECWNVATLRPVIVVAKGNPKGIRSFKDLVQPGLRIVLSDPVYSTLGHIITAMADKAGISEKLDSAVVTRTKGSAGAADAISLGTADAAVVWNAVAFLRKDKIDAVEIEPDFTPNVDAITTATFGPVNVSCTNITVSTLSTSKQIQEAKSFASYMASEEAAKVWAEQGFSQKK